MRAMPDVVRDAVLSLLAGPTWPGGRALQVLDVGGGTGGMAVPLAGLGHQVTVVDPSPDALAALERRADEAAVVVRGIQADATQLAEVVPLDSVDLVCCHGVLEYVDDPAATMRVVAAVLRPGGAASLLVAQRSATVLARALAGRFVEALRALDDPDGRWGAIDPLPRRFDLPAVRALAEDAGLLPGPIHGVRLFGDLVPQALVDTEEARMALAALEGRAGEHLALSQLASQLHLVARRPSTTPADDQAGRSVG